MAITAAQMQTALGTNATDVRILRHFQPNVGSVQEWLAHGNAVVPGRVRMVRTTAADNAATQAAALIASLRVG
jgi:hypothetical protein